MCVLLLVSLLQKSSFRVLLQSSVCKNVPSDFAFPKHLLFICQNRANKTNTALSISIIPLIKAIFGLSGLEFCQKLQICMPNLVMLITHFGQKFKNPPPKCPSRGLSQIWLDLCRGPAKSQYDLLFTPEYKTRVANFFWDQIPMWLALF